jgi:hypothetical protein
MAKPRGKYDKTNKLSLTDKDRADDIIECIKQDMADWPNLAASINAIRRATPRVRKIVIDTVFAPLIREPGRPQRLLRDEETLLAVEQMKEHLASKTPGKVTDRRALRQCFEIGWLRLGRLPGVPFNADSIAGKQEMARGIAAAVRARKARKSKNPPE